MKTLEELKQEIEDIDITYHLDETYANLWNTMADYWNETQDSCGEELFDDYIDYDIAEEYAKHELETGGLIRLWCFLGDINADDDIFRINGYGNLTSVDNTDLQDLKDELLDAINEKMEEERSA